MTTLSVTDCYFMHFLAIDICFGLTDLFPSEILAAAIQQLVDNPTLPVLFMRTVRFTARYR